MVGAPHVLRPMEEGARMSRNEAAQTGFQAIEVLKICEDQLPAEAAVRTVREFRGRPGPAAPVAPR
jgi:hypothetical protein